MPANRWVLDSRRMIVNVNGFENHLGRLYIYIYILYIDISLNSIYLIYVYMYASIYVNIYVRMYEWFNAIVLRIGTSHRIVHRIKIIIKIFLRWYISIVSTWFRSDHFFSFLKRRERERE